MAGGNEGNEGQSGKGFSGLSSMVSDVDATVTSAENASRGADDSPGKGAASGTLPHQRAADRQQPRSGGYQEPLAQPTSAGGSSAGKWLLGIGAIIGFIWLLSESGNKSSAPSPTYTPPPQSPATASPAPSWQPPAAAPQPQVSGRPSEEKPPVGTDLVLSVPQIRYCVAEDIRLDAAKGVINNFVESDVDRFNAMVSDYNSRCGQFRYRRGALESARSDMEAIRSSLQAEGRNRFQRTPGVSLERSPQDSTRPSFDGVVFAVQRRLNELGYDVGTPDGLVGARTRSAISTFQSDHGLPVDGAPSASLVSRLDAVKSARPNMVPSEQPLPRATRETTPSSIPPAAPVQRALEQPTLSSEERQSIEYACQSDKLMNGPAAYNACVQSQLARLTPGNRRPDLSGLSPEERQSIEYACQTDKLMNGPAAYNACLRNQLAQLASGNRRPNLSGLSPEERQSIEYACQTDKLMNGPAAYNSCLRTQLAQLTADNRRPSLSGLSANERQSIEYACQTDKLMNGPAAYNSCLSRQLLRLRQ